MMKSKSSISIKKVVTGIVFALVVLVAAVFLFGMQKTYNLVVNVTDPYLIATSTDGTLIAKVFRVVDERGIRQEYVGCGPEEDCVGPLDYEDYQVKLNGQNYGPVYDMIEQVFFTSTNALVIVGHIEGESHTYTPGSEEPLSISINEEIVYSTTSAGWFQDVLVDKDTNFSFRTRYFNGEKYEEQVYVNGNLQHGYDFIDGYVLIDPGFAYVGCNGRHTNFQADLHTRSCELTVVGITTPLEYNVIENMVYEPSENQLQFDAVVGCTLPDLGEQCLLNPSEQCYEQMWAQRERCALIEEPESIVYPL